MATNNQIEKAPARAPYNFVPLVDGYPLKAELVDNKPISHDRYHDDRLTGYFDVELETVTPLFTRGMLTEEQLQAGKQAKDLPEPFILNGKPVIPGSSLRGMLRNLVEIITFGKMHFISDANKIFYRAVAAKGDDPQGNAYKTIFGGLNQSVHAGKNVRAGYLKFERGQWFIQPAAWIENNPFALVPDRNNVVSGVKGLQPLRSGQYRLGCYDVDYDEIQHNNKVGRVWTPKQPAKARSVLVCTGNMAETQSGGGNVRTPRKNFVLLSKETEGEPIQLSKGLIEDYLEGLTPFQRGDSEQSKGYLDPKFGILQHGKPVFYIQQSNKVIGFGHTPNFRIAHLNALGQAITPRDKVPEHLLDQNLVDYADAMFGYVSEDGQAKRDPVAYAGRISVTSATYQSGPDDGDPFGDTVIIRTPGSPKPTTFQHYLEQPKRARQVKEDLHHYGTSNARIRGHKMYWRQKVDIWDLEQKNPEEKDRKKNVDTEFKPLKKGIVFRFRVYFENLTPAELGALEWALTFDGDERLHHMIGMGKPYGLGVVKMWANLILTDRGERYRYLFAEDGSWYAGAEEGASYIDDFKQVIRESTGTPFEETERIKQLKAILRFYETPDDTFRYQTIEPNEYTDRPVLPYPTEIEMEMDTIEAQQAELERASAIEQAAAAKDSLDEGDEISGEVFDADSDLWFEPQRVRIQGRWVDVAELGIGPYDYEAQVPAEHIVRGRDVGGNVKAVILENRGGDPAFLVCRQIDPNED